MTHAKISSGVQHRVYILHVLRIKDKQKKLSSKCFEKLSTWLKCLNFFATPRKFLIEDKQRDLKNEKNRLCVLQFIVSATLLNL